MSTAACRTYKDAIEALNTLQSNAAVFDSIRAAGVRQGDEVVAETLYYLCRLGYKPSDLNALNVIHITGTKGKGSTSAFCSSLLTSLAPHAKVGLFTSPHLVSVKERIRINGVPVGEEVFAKGFWEVWDRFGDSSVEHKDSSLPDRPAYFRFLTLLAYHLFLSLKVDATVLEVGVGGTVDATNIVPSPLVTGVTDLGVDHIFILGNTVEEIAGHKGGIFKPGVPALTVKQPDGPRKVLEARAVELKASSFSVVPAHPEIPSLKLGLSGIHQQSNASLAIALTSTFLASPRCPEAFASLSLPCQHDPTASPNSSSNLPPVPSQPSATLPPPSEHPLPTLSSETVSPTPLPEAFRKGLEEARWPGRCQLVKRNDITWALDGAHTTESIRWCGKWYREAVYNVSSKQRSQPRRILIFNCTSGRNVKDLLETLLETTGNMLKGVTPKPTGESSFIITLPSGTSTLEAVEGRKTVFDEAVFCTNVTYSSGLYKGDLAFHAIHAHDLSTLKVQNELASVWNFLLDDNAPHNSIKVLPSIEDAVKVVREAGEKEEVEVLVTGSLHLIGGVMEVAGLTDTL